MSFETARVTAAIEAAVDDTTHIQLHDGAPGSGGTANVITDFTDTRRAFVFPSATAGVTSQVTTFTVDAPLGPVTHATGWNQASGGTLQWTAELSPQESFAGSEGSLQVTITATASNPS